MSDALEGQGSPTPEPNPAPPTPDQQEAARLTQMLNQGKEAGTFTLPENFDTVESFVKSFQTLRADHTRKSQELAQKGNQPSTDNTSPNSGSPSSDGSSGSSALPADGSGVSEQPSSGGSDWTDLSSPPPAEPKTADVWTTIQSELAEKGSLSAEKAKELGIPDAMVAQLNKSHKAAIESDRQAAENLVGGSERLQKIQAWAKQNLPQEERDIVSAQLKGPGWQFVLEGLAQRYARSTQEKPGINVPSGGSAPQTAAPWASQAEMQQYISSPAYKAGDPRAVAYVNQRTAATMKLGRR